MTPPDIVPNLSKPGLIFYDDFSAGQLDRSQWNVRTTGKVVNNEQQAYVDSDETIYVASTHDDAGGENQLLVLHPRYRPGHKTPDSQSFDFISGRIDTKEKFHFAYGSASVRMKLPAGPGLWPAFWAMGNGNWPENGEIDVMEYVGEADWVSSALHGPGYSGESALVNKLFFRNGEDATSWHIYTVDWVPNKIVFKVDGMVIYRVTRPMVDFFGPWVFNGEKYLILNLALGGVYPFKTNGILSPYYGISEETVDNIKNDQVQVLIDWVSVFGN
jgi:beta-glucanase (GH16 family)